MINEKYAHPKRSSDYSNKVSSCHVTGYSPVLPLCNKNSPHSKLKLHSRKLFQLPVPSSEIFYTSTPQP